VSGRRYADTPSKNPADGAVAAARRQLRLTVGVVMALAGAGLLVFALVNWSGDDGDAVGVPGDTSAPADTPGEADPGTGDEADQADERFLPEGFGEAVVTITAVDGETCEVCVLTASTAQARAQGLMGVTDPGLGGYDGMLFEYDEDAGGSFWMRNTLLALSIAWFDADGSVVSTADMEPCPDDVADADCPRYAPDGAYRAALEVPQGALDDLLVTEGSTLQVEARTCPGPVTAT
jgi:uncharacterized membrane protein (UPF0127 family)